MNEIRLITQFKKKTRSVPSFTLLDVIIRKVLRRKAVKKFRKELEIRLMKNGIMVVVRHTNEVGFVNRII